MKKHLLFLILALIGTLFLSACTSERSLNKKSVLFEVHQGESLNHVARRLKHQKIIFSPTRFKVLARLMKKDRKLMVGVYQIPVKTSYRDIINLLTSGKTYSIKVTIPEGFTLFQIAELLEKKGLIKAQDFINACRRPDILEKYKIEGESLEGYLFPDTYLLPMHFQVDEIIEIMLKRFHEVVDQKILSELKRKNLSLNKLLAMASIVERETRLEYEKPIVAGVYYNRLKKRMRLQADPTLIYALILDGRYDGNIRFRDLRPPYPSPYNTYYVYGLPKGPIANPGKTSILAALYPARVPYLYFVAKPDGSHDFSVTLEEHNRKVYMYQKRHHK